MALRTDSTPRSLLTCGLLVVSLGFAGCGDSNVEKPTETNENEVITTVTLRFVPDDGSATFEASFRDPDGDGGGAPTIDPITLSSGRTYAVTVSFLNELETPAEDITEEVNDESDVHQVFFTGAGVQSPSTSDDPDAVVEQDYDDTDENGLPVGLASTFTGLQAGTGELTVTLRHMPPVNGTAVKVAGLAELVASGGIEALPGTTDASVTFSVTVD